MAATALGARVIEKHFILDRTLGGPDASFSMTPDEFAHMVEGVRQVEVALGSVSYHLNDKTLRNRKFARSLFVCEDMKAGDTFTSRNVRSIRPADGLPPVHLPSLLGRHASQDIQAGTPLAWSLIS
jgi:pseudaminic acid synthase